MKNPVFGGLAAANAGGGVFAHPVGAASRRHCAPAAYRGTRVPAASGAAAISQHITISNDQDMTRLGAAGGSVPGSHPGRDPV
jgi:hypothetical protein